MDLKFLYLTLRGRISRQTFWMGLIPLLVASWVASFIIQQMAFMVPGDPLVGALATGMMLLVTAATLIGFISICVKRLHDRGKSGWWLASLYAVSIAQVFVVATAGLAMTPVGPSSLGSVLSAIGLGILLWLIVELGILKGTRGPNEDGPDPLEPAAADTAS